MFPSTVQASLVSKQLSIWHSKTKQRKTRLKVVFMGTVHMEKSGQERTNLHARVHLLYNLAHCLCCYGAWHVGKCSYWILIGRQHSEDLGHCYWY